MKIFNTSKENSQAGNVKLDIESNDQISKSATSFPATLKISCVEGSATIDKAEVFFEAERTVSWFRTILEFVVILGQTATPDNNTPTNEETQKVIASFSVDEPIHLELGESKILNFVLSRDNKRPLASWPKGSLFGLIKTPKERPNVSFFLRARVKIDGKLTSIQITKKLVVLND